jgi:dipeptidyl aminopeptidase/acylaminoacyl peptidase
MTSSPSDTLGSLITTTAPAVAPDGSQIAFCSSRVDLESNTYRAQIWVAPADGSSPARPLTEGRRGDGSPVWSPDGTRLAFTSHRGAHEEETTVHILPITVPGETITVCTTKQGIDELAWSPDGTMLAFTSRVDPERDGESDPAKQPPRRISRFFSRLDDVGWVHDRPSHLWVVPADGTAAPEDLTPGEHSFGNPAWLPDSRGLVVSGGGHDGWDLDLAVDLYLVPLSDDRRRLTDGGGTYQLPSVAPDGATVAFLGSDDPLTHPQNTRVGLLDLADGAEGGHRWVSTALDRSFAPTPGVRAPVWLDGALLASAEDRGSSRLYRVDPESRRAPEPLTPEGMTVPGFDAAGATIAVLAGTATAPPELGVVDEGGGAPRPLSHLGDRFVTRTSPRPMEHLLAPSTGGVEVDTWVITPPDFDPGGSYPVLLNVHGGPFTQYGHFYFDEAQIQAAAGYVVVLANPRGSSGRSEEWGQAILGPLHPRRPGTGWGSVDVDDVLAALDEALRRYPAADTTRVGVLGGSYGGYMASWLAGHHGERFAAVCSERAVNNLLSLECSSDIATAFRTTLGVSHLEHPEEYRRMSPIEAVDRITTPMLILHSEDDHRCPISQAEELFVALRSLGRDVTFYRFPAESHELSRSGSPRHRVQRAEIILEFFGRHLVPGRPPGEESAA